MSDDDMKTVQTSDLDASAFLSASGYVFLYVRASERRATFVHRDSTGAGGSRALFNFYANAHLRRMLAQRKLLRRALGIAQASPTKVCSAADLEAHLAAWASAQERPHESESATTRSQ
jgi:hypothetical protein